MDKLIKSPEVIIIGAGLTGLSLAHNLLKMGISCNVLERSSRTGGVIHTIHESGFTYETGPNTGVIGNPYVIRLFDELKGECKLETARASAKKRLILKNGNWHPLPSSLSEAIKTPLFNIKDKFRILLEPFRKKGTNRFESIADLVRRRMGVSFLDYAVDPFIAGIYAGDPDYLVTRFALPKLYALEQKYGSFIRGAIIKKFETKIPGSSRVTREVFSTENGLGSLISALESTIGSEKIKLNVSDIDILPYKNYFRISYNINGERITVEAKNVITTTPAQELPLLLPFLNENLLSPIIKLKYAPVIQIVLAFHEWRGMDINAFGGLIPSKERRNLLGVLIPSSYLNDRAPEGGALLSVFMGGEKNHEVMNLTDQDITTLVSSQVRELMKLVSFSPQFIRIFRYDYAIPQYGRDSELRLDAINRIQMKYPGLILAGNIRDGIGMADRIQQAGIIAGEIVEKLKGLNNK